MPVTVLDPREGSGLTKDISVSGVLFETSCPLSSGVKLIFCIDMDGPDGPARLKCEGTVVRVNTGESGLSVAVKIDDSTTGPALIGNATLN